MAYTRVIDSVVGGWLAASVFIQTRSARGSRVSDTWFALFVAAVAFSMGLIGLIVHAWEPGNEGVDETRDLINRLTGLVATMSALVLGLMIANASNFFNTQKIGLETVSAQVLELDGVLHRYGPEAAPARALLRGILQHTYDDVWGPGSAKEPPSAGELIDRTDKLFVALNTLLEAAPDNRKYRMQKAEDLATAINDQRLRMSLQVNDSLSWPFMTVLVLWICLLFFGFGMVARFNRVGVGGMAVGALSVASAIFLIMELSTPYDGIIMLSSDPIVQTIQALGH